MLASFKSSEITCLPALYQPSRAGILLENFTHVSGEILHTTLLYTSTQHLCVH